MSDLRDFYGSDEASFSDIRIVEPVEHVEPLPPSFQEPIGGEHAEPLGAFHTIEVEDTGNTGRVVAGLAIALMVGAAAVYGYEVSSSPKPAAPVVTASNHPMPAVTPPPAQSAATTPVAPSAPSDTLNAPAASPPAAEPVPAKKAPVRSTRGLASEAPASPSVPETAAVTPSPSAGVPEQSAAVQPVYPTAPASSLANNNQPLVTPTIGTPDAPDATPSAPEVTPPVQSAPEDQVQQTPAPAPAPDQSAQPAQ